MRRADIFRHPFQFAIALLSLGVMVHAVEFAFHNTSATPYWDFWNWLADFKRYEEGHYAVADLIAPHNEHRILTTRLVLFVDALFFRMTGGFAIATNFGVLAAVGIVLGMLCRRAGSPAARDAAVLTVPAAFMLSVCQWPNLVMPFQVQHGFLCIGIVGAAASISAATAPGRSSRIALAYAAFAGLWVWIAAFSMAGGLLALPWLALQLLMRRAPPRVIAVFAVLAAGAAAAFLYDYHPMRANPLTLRFDPRTLRDLVTFACGFIGSPFYPFGKLPFIAGFVGLSAFAASLAVLATWTFGGGRRISGSMAALAAIAGTIALAAAAAAVSRLSIGMGEALQPRYCTVALLFWVGAGGLVLQILRVAFPAACERRAVRAPLAMLAGAALVVLNFAPRYREDARWFSGLLNAQGETMRQNVYVPPLFRMMFYGNRAEAAGRIAFLHQHGLSVFAPGAGEMPPAPLLASLRGAAVSWPPCDGRMELAYRLDASRAVLRGWLAPASVRRAADWVILLTQAGDIAAAMPAAEYRHKLGSRPRIIRSARGAYGGFVLPAGDAGNSVTLRAAGLFAGRPDLTCVLPGPVIFLPLRDQPPESVGGAHPIAPAPAFEAAGAFQKDGLAAGALTAPPENQAVFASAKAGDAGTGEMSFTLDPGRSDIAVPFAVGPDASGQSLSVAFPGGARQDFAIPRDTPDAAWHMLAIPRAVIAGHGAGPITITAHDDGIGWGQWMAVAMPEAVTLDPDWARLY